MSIEQSLLHLKQTDWNGPSCQAEKNISFLMRALCRINFSFIWINYIKKLRFFICLLFF